MLKLREISVTIRKAKKEDMTQVYKLIRDGNILQIYNTTIDQIIPRLFKSVNCVTVESSVEIALAEFEKLEHTMTINAESLEKDGFESDNPPFTCLVAELSDGYIIGYALYYTSYSTWLGRSIFLEDLYVQPAYRKNGIGTQLFLAVAKIAHETPSKRMDFHVLSWNPAGDFYKRMGAVDMTIHEKWHHFRMNESCLNKLFSSTETQTSTSSHS